MLHVGPFSQERPSIERFHAGIAEAGFRERGKHHELYLGIRGGAPLSDSARSSATRSAGSLEAPDLERIDSSGHMRCCGLGSYSDEWAIRIRGNGYI